MDFKELDQWCAETQERREYLMSYGRTGKPSSPEERMIDATVCIGLEHEASEFLIAAEQFLTNYESAAMLETRRENPDLNSRERGLIEASKVAPVVFLVEGLRITKRSITSRYFSKRS